MDGCFNIYRYYRRLRIVSECQRCIIFLCIICVLIYLSLKIKLSIDYHYAHDFYRTQQYNSCPRNNITKREKQKLILFWTTVFKSPIDADYLNGIMFTKNGRCGTDQCRVTRDRHSLCDSDAVIFHARGGIKLSDMPKARSFNQRYVLLTKEPPYKTSAIVGHLDNYFNWTATYRLDSDIEYRYFSWRKKDNIIKNSNSQSYLKNRKARAASMISNCYSHNNREDYLNRLKKIVPISSVGFCSWNKCRKTRNECLNELAETHPFYLAFENSLCQDYVTEKYANTMINGRMIPVVFSQSPKLYVPNSFINANDFASPEDLGQYLIKLVKNSTAYDNYFKWKNEYDLIVPNEDDYLCELCRKLNDPKEPRKIYRSMQKWMFDDANCQRWTSKLNQTMKIPIDDTMDYEDPLF